MALYEFDGKRPQVPADSFVHPNAVLIGDVKIGHECMIAPGVSIRADFSPIRIGDRSNVQDNSVIHANDNSHVIIENDVTIAHGVVLHDVHIKARCFIGIGAIVLFDVVCEEDFLYLLVPLSLKACIYPPGKLLPEILPRLHGMSRKNKKSWPKKVLTHIVKFAENTSLTIEFKW